MHISEKRLRGAKLEALYSWFIVAAPTCFKCKHTLRWDQRRFWEELNGARVYFFCDCGFENPLNYLRFKWETTQDLRARNIKTK